MKTCISVLKEWQCGKLDMCLLHWWNQGCRKHTLFGMLCALVLCTYELREASHRQPTGSCYKLKQTDSLFVVHLFHHLQEHKSICYCNTYTTGLCVFRSVDYSVSIPARTSESACCSSCSVYKWCSSANRPNRSPAYHRASAATHRTTGSAMCPPCFMGAWDRTELNQCVHPWLI